MANYPDRRFITREPDAESVWREVKADFENKEIQISVRNRVDRERSAADVRIKEFEQRITEQTSNPEY